MVELGWNPKIWGMELPTELILLLGNGTVIMMEKWIKMDGFLLDLLCLLGIPSFDSYPNSQDVRCHLSGCQVR
jgi:hypothetical protein